MGSADFVHINTLGGAHGANMATVDWQGAAWIAYQFLGGSFATNGWLLANIGDLTGYVTDQNHQARS
ncbi:MAG TPA: hypothetical protein VIY53_16275 [Acidobacteriaceae bacterium]